MITLFWIGTNLGVRYKTSESDHDCMETRNKLIQIQT